MICIFPDPHPDELLYSVCARYSVQMPYGNKITAVEDFFGKGKSAIVDLPGSVNHLINLLPPGHLYTVDELINKNTTLPFYALFLPPERAHLCHESLATGEIERSHERLGSKVAGIPSPSYVRFCPTCVVEDRQEYGETYWHHAHQLTGIEVCPLHGCFLESSTVAWQKKALKPHSAEDMVADVPPRPLNLTDACNVMQLKIAREAVWLLNEWRTPTGLQVLRHRYHNRLLERGYAYYNGRIRTTRLLQDFESFYSPTFLASLWSPIESETHNWLLRLVRRSRVPAVQHPLRHILLMIFLGLTAEELFTSFKEYTPFGEGPWPCLNAASDHHMEARVTRCRITDSLTKGKAGKPQGEFACDCGYIYIRTGPDSEEKDRFRKDLVLAYGTLWDERLRQHWNDTAITIQEIASRLSVCEGTIIRQVKRLGLSYPRGSAVVVTRRGVESPELKLTLCQPMQEKIEARRKEWATVIAANPQATRKELLKVAYYLYLWLRRNDREWFDANSPPVGDRRSPGRVVNWAEHDPKLAAVIKATVQRIKNLPGRPVHASKAAVIREVGYQIWIENRLDKLPLTAKALAENLEPLEAYMIRKVEWATEFFIQEGKCPTRLQLMVKASVRNAAGWTPIVQDALNIAEAKLEASAL
jgi:hypothetical protein